jgi:hypothetical protein
LEGIAMRDAKGRFLPGPDPDRHPLTRAERRRGYRNAVVSPRPGGPCDNARVLAWVFRRVRGYYRQTRREAG